jgi:hypothetical protein
MADLILTTDRLQKSLELKSGELRIDHRIVAEGLGFVNTGKKKAATNWRRFVLEKYEAELSELGMCFKHILDDGTEVWYLNEAQVNFAGTLSRNSKEAVAFKLRLVKAFEKAKKALIAIDSNRQNAEWIEVRNSGKRTRREETDAIKDFIEYAKSQGSQSADRYYCNISKMQNQALFLVEQKYPNLRDVLNIQQLGVLGTADAIVRKALHDGMQQGLHYKDIYKLAKNNVEVLAGVHGKVLIPSKSNQLGTR